MLAEALSEELSENARLLDSWPTLVGLLNKSFSVIVSTPGLMANTAVAFTDPSEVVLPDGVVNVIGVPIAIPEIIGTATSRRTNKVLRFWLMDVSLVFFGRLITARTSMAVAVFLLNWMHFQTVSLEQLLGI